MGEAPSPSTARPSSGTERGRHRRRGGHDDRVGSEHLVADVDRPAPVDGHDGRDLCPQTDRDSGRGEGPRPVGAVQLGQRHRRPADVASVVGLEEPGAKDHGGQGQGGLVGPHVERRQHDQVPQALDGPGTLAVSGQPGAEALPIERRIGQVEAAQGQQGPAEPEAVGHRDVPVPQERGGQVQGGGRPGAGDGRPPTPGSKHGEVEAGLEVDLVAGADATEEVPVGGATAQKDVLAVVEPHPIALEGPGETAELGPSLHEDHLESALGTLERGCHPRQATTDDDHPARHGRAPARLRTATKAFSQAGRDTRPRVTARGSRAIWPRSRW